MANSVVVWDIVQFLTAYPQFGDGMPQAVPSDTLAAYFEIACSIVDNTESSPIPYDPADGVYLRQIILFAIVCHLATVNGWAANGQNGPLASANEGSVSVSFQTAQYKGTGDLAVWLRQTPCGQTAWMLLSRYAYGGRLYTVKHCHPWG